MKSESEIIGAMVRRLLSLNPYTEIGRKLLIEELSLEYCELYDSGELTEDYLAYESVLRRLINSADHPYY